jgi:enoyl-[acyl-carrier protein] reductase I
MSVEGKNVVVLGVADESSIAWAIARAFAEHGAKVHIGYQQKFFSRVRLLLVNHPKVRGQRCDVLNPEELAAFFEPFRQDPIDVLVHAIAYGPPEFFTHDPSDVSAEAFTQSLVVSAHSLCTAVRYAKTYMREWGSVMTLTYQASERAEPSYGMMGVAKSALESTVRYLAVEMGTRKIRVNAISPGPVETVAALGILSAFQRHPQSLNSRRSAIFEKAIRKARERGPYPDEFAMLSAAWKHFQSEIAERCPIGDTISKEDVAGCALFLGSDYSRKITGQVLHIDCGYSSSTIM